MIVLILVVLLPVVAALFFGAMLLLAKRLDTLEERQRQGKRSYLGIDWLDW